MNVRPVVFGFVVLLAANEPGRTDIAGAHRVQQGHIASRAPTRTAAFAAADK
jgi:hypothetical protein